MLFVVRTAQPEGGFAILNVVWLTKKTIAKGVLLDAI